VSADCRLLCCLEFLARIKVEFQIMSDAKHSGAGEQLVFIGHIETPYKTPADCPYTVNPGGPECRIVLKSQYATGLTGLEVGGRILVLYWLDKASRNKPLVAERRSGKVAGAFAARTPHRPNPIGAAMLLIDSIEGAVLKVRGLDCVSGTPLLDIKPAMRAEFPAGGGGA
jgi:tRNA-Thr(GGU) m(6)t(6)A37 methyltransferase TsaA